MAEGQLIKIAAVDILYINEVAKALKQKSVMWYQDYLIGIDTNNYLCYTRLDSNKINFQHNIAGNYIFNQRELSKFSKSIITEQGFDVPLGTNGSCLICTTSETLSVFSNIQTVNNFIPLIKAYESRFINGIEKDVTNELEFIFSMNKTAGINMYKYDNTHILTLFGGLLPLNKSDKIYIILEDNIDGKTFTVRFRVHKKICDIIIFLNYLKI